VLASRSAPKIKKHMEAGLLATCSMPDPKGLAMASDVLHELK
jgi:hypothetical protein